MSDKGRRFPGLCRAAARLLRRCAATWLVLFASHAGAAAPLVAPDIALNYDQIAHVLHVTVANRTQTPISFYDTFTNKIYPALLTVRIEDQSGAVLSGSDVFPDGFVTSHVFDSDVIVPPVQLSKLKPSASIVSAVHVASMLRGMQKFVRVDLKNLSGHCLRFKLELVLSEDFAESLTRVSDSYCV